MKLKSMLIWALRRRQVKAFIQTISDPQSRLDKFNDIWQDAYINVPFYENWKRQHNLPDRIGSICELANWPILEKKELILNSDKLVRKDGLEFHESVTGGATGEPLHFRTMPGESDAIIANLWRGWARMGLLPDSRCFLLWGHRHFYGQGWKSNLKFVWRRCKDWMTNNLRADATDLSQEALEKDVIKIIRFRPEGIIAYSASLLALVRSCSKYRKICRGLNVKAVICTAGPLTKEERLEISEFFNAPVGMEYGSMEAKVMAYQTPANNGKYQVFDETHILQAQSEETTGRQQILVTALTHRYLPLIRYRIGDYMEGPIVREDGTVSEFAEVTGRVGDMVDLGDGKRFHGYSMMVCAEANKKIVAYQLKVNRKTHRVTLVMQVLKSLTADEKAAIRRHAADVAAIDGNLIEVEEATELVKAPSGKIILVLTEE